MGIRLKTTILDSGGGNRLNSINNNEFRLYPDCFEDETTFQTVTSFSSYDIYNASGCSGRKSGSDLYVTPSTNNNTFSFALTNGGTTINGFALAALGQSNISVSLVKNTLSESTNNLSGLCTSNKINLLSPSRPNKLSPYRLGDFRGYCHNAAGGFNIYNPNGSDVSYLATYSLTGAATKNQQSYTGAKIDIQIDNVSQGTSTKSLSNSCFIDKTITGLTNNYFWTTSANVKVVVSKLNDDNTTYSEVSNNTVSKVFRGKPFIGVLNLLQVNTNTARLSYSYNLSNQTGSNTTMYVKVKNVTKGSPYTQMTHTVNANTTNQTFTGVTGLMGVTNQVGDSFDIIVSGNGADYIPFESGDTWTLNYGI